MKQKTVVQAIDKIVANLLKTKTKLSKLDADTRVVVHVDDAFIGRMRFKMGSPTRARDLLGKNPHTVRLNIEMFEAR